MRKYIAKDDDRLDTIVYKYYGTLDVFAEVLSVNSHLDAILNAGDIVYLPEITIQADNKANALW